jgi:hypothetical protein
MNLPDHDIVSRGVVRQIILEPIWPNMTLGQSAAATVNASTSRLRHEQTLEKTKTLMGVLGRMLPKPHAEMKLGKKREPAEANPRPDSRKKPKKHG